LHKAYRAFLHHATYLIAVHARKQGIAAIFNGQKQPEISFSEASGANHSTDLADVGFRWFQII